ncbi:MAG TPA: STAS domain-containing protein [Nostocaceae cyanobacterium]|nr:STAS domain-containing protein [Nostocaceae cyanobacterium]
MLTTLNYPKITVVRPCGYLNATNTGEFEQDLTRAISQDRNAIVLVDLGAVESLDSAGLMTLVSGFKLADSLGRTLRISSVSPAVKIILELTQLDQVFEIWELEAELATA